MYRRLLFLSHQQQVPGQRGEAPPVADRDQRPGHPESVQLRRQPALVRDHHVRLEAVPVKQLQVMDQAHLRAAEGGELLRDQDAPHR